MKKILAAAAATAIVASSCGTMVFAASDFVYDPDDATTKSTSKGIDVSYSPKASYEVTYPAAIIFGAISDVKPATVSLSNVILDYNYTLSVKMATAKAKLTNANKDSSYINYGYSSTGTAGSFTSFVANTQVDLVSVTADDEDVDDLAVSKTVYLSPTEDHHTIAGAHNDTLTFYVNYAANN